MENVRFRLAPDGPLRILYRRGRKIGTLKCGHFLSDKSRSQASVLITKRHNKEQVTLAKLILIIIMQGKVVLSRRAFSVWRQLTVAPTLATHRPDGNAPIQLYSLATPNGQKIAIALEGTHPHLCLFAAQRNLNRSLIPLHRNGTPLRCAQNRHLKERPI